MSEKSHDDLAGALQAVMPATDAPPFERVFHAAELEASASRRRRRYTQAAGVTVLLGAATLLSVMLTRAPAIPATESLLANDLLQTTRWTAPSDVLLPKRDVDLYQELPAWPVSTESTEGTLL